MATLSLRMRDDLKAKAQALAADQGVSLNSYINATLAATIAQAETLAMMGTRLADVDQKRLHNRVLKFMSEARKGSEPSSKTIQQPRSE